MDAPLEGRVHEFCGRLKKKVFRSSGNAALIQYRIPSRGDGFRITVRYTKNPAREYWRRRRKRGEEWVEIGWEGWRRAGGDEGKVGWLGGNVKTG